MSALSRRRFTRSMRGGFRVHLSDDERALLASLPLQLQDLLSRIEHNDTEVSDIARRLFPPAHAVDLDAEGEYVKANRESLLSHHRESLDVLATTAYAPHLTDEELEQWLGALNDLRIVIGNSLGVTEDSAMADPDDPLYGEWVCYHFFSYLVGEIVDSLTGLLPPPTDDDMTSLPDDPWGEPPGGLRWDGTELPGSI